MPDLAGWRRDRMAEPPEAAAIELAPDWICEVLSPGVRRERVVGGAARARDSRRAVNLTWTNSEAAAGRTRFIVPSDSMLCAR